MIKDKSTYVDLERVFSYNDMEILHTAVDKELKETIMLIKDLTTKKSRIEYTLNKIKEKLEDVNHL